MHNTNAKPERFEIIPEPTVFHVFRKAEPNLHSLLSQSLLGREDMAMMWIQAQKTKSKSLLPKYIYHIILCLDSLYLEEDFALLLSLLYFIF